MLKLLHNYFKQKGYKAFPFQEQCWKAYFEGKSGLLNAPTGSGKTFALALPILAQANQFKGKKGIKAIWISPIKALTKDLQLAISEAAKQMDIDWQIATRTGDTTAAERAKLTKKQPDFLITTPESLQLMLTQKDADKVFENLQAIVIDEWHELIGNKRGVQMELSISYLVNSCNRLKVWGISATIGNLEEAKQVLLYPLLQKNKEQTVLVKAQIDKQIEIISVLPNEVENYPWAGHLGLKLIDKIIPIIEQANTTLIFTNTRAQTEIWYKALLEANENLAGKLAMHHGSLSNEIRSWVEENLHAANLKAVVCTSSLDLGVDFRPVDQIIQIGGPKGVARFLQRAGRSGHQPGAKSTIYFVPTNALELMEAAALRQSITDGKMESKIPILNAFDVLSQYLVTLAVGSGFHEKRFFNQVKSTFCFKDITENDWDWLLTYITKGGKSLAAYDEFYKVIITEEGLYKVVDKRIAMRHRLSIGTITSDSVLVIKYVKGGTLGTVEEWFFTKLKEGSVFWFAGKTLELVEIRNQIVYVKKSNAKNAVVPSWQGGRMPLSSQVSEMIRQGLNNFPQNSIDNIEFQSIASILNTQQQLSLVPKANQLLIEKLKTKDGYHVYIYPFEGRLVHEGIASLIAYRISVMQPISISMAFNDYGFELLSDEPIPIEDAIGDNAFGLEDLNNDLLNSMNAAEMARRKFRDIAKIAGLIFTGFPGKNMLAKHLQASSKMFFEVFNDIEPENLFLQQSYNEVLNDQLEEKRLRAALKRINNQEIIIKNLEQASPFCFPIMVDRLREKLSSEKLEDRIAKMIAHLEKD